MLEELVGEHLAQRVKDLGFELPEWCLTPSDCLVEEFETKFSLQLPPDYREFLRLIGGAFGSAHCDFLEPTPIGEGSYINTFFGFTGSDRTDNVTEATELIQGAPVAIAIGDNLMGDMFVLVLLGEDAGSVYVHDGDGRAAWPDEWFHSNFPNLRASIRRYLELRANGTLPEKPDAYTHLYQVSRTFSEFVERLRPSDDDEDD